LIHFLPSPLFAAAVALSRGKGESFFKFVPENPYCLDGLFSLPK